MCQNLSLCQNCVYHLKKSPRQKYIPNNNNNNKNNNNNNNNVFVVEKCKNADEKKCTSKETHFKVW
jgi:hypothetical protein